MTTRPKPLPLAELMKIIEAADPARNRAPLSPKEIEMRVDAALAESQSTKRATPPPTPRTRRVTLAVTLVAAAAAAVVGIVAIQTQTPPRATNLTQASSSTSGKCVPVSPQSIATSTAAFRATVTSLSGGSVTLSVTKDYTHNVERTVTVAQGADKGVSDGGPLVFEKDRSYLISTMGSTIRTCTQSGLATPNLTSIYDSAFSAER